MIIIIYNNNNDNNNDNVFKLHPYNSYTTIQY